MKRAVAFAIALCVAGCFPSLPDEPYRVATQRILAIRAEPAEAPPGERVAYEALIATKTGTIADAVASWAFCVRPRVIDERNGVAPACLDETADHILPIAGGRGFVPMNVCTIFGSVPAASAPGEPPLRAADPDETGGYFLPVRATADVTSFGFQRVRCQLDSAPFEVARDFAVRYVPNRHPQIVSVTLDGTELRPRETSITSGAKARLEITWTASTAETYVHFDAGLVDLVERTESMSVSWYATAGDFANARSILSEADSAAGTRSATNEWTAPLEATRTWIWIVLRDSRGGVAWRGFVFDVR